MPNMKVAIGVDIGGTNTVFGLVDEQGNCLVQQSIKTKDFPDPENFVAVLSAKLKELIASEKNLTVIGLGVGAPNGNYYTGTIDFAPNLNWNGVVPLVQLFKKHFSFPVVLTNDANAAAIGERIYGAAKGINDFVMVTLGTGLGSGLEIGRAHV